MKTETELNRLKEHWKTYILENVDGNSKFAAIVRDYKTFTGNYEEEDFPDLSDTLSNHQLSYLMGVWDSLLKALED